MLTCSPELLAKTPTFRKLSSRERRDVSQLALSKELDEGEFLAYQGDTWPYVVLIEEGEIKVHKISQQGRALGALRLGPGRIFWSPSLIDEGPLPASLEACQDCRVFLWHSEHILPYLLKNPDALWELCNQLMRRIRQASEMVEDLAFHPVANRLARLLVKQYQPKDELQVDRSLTLDEMATMIGTTPVMVCKILSRFADEGLIKVRRSEFEFLDWEQIEEMAGSP